MKKKILGLVLGVTLVMSMLVGCGTEDTEGDGGTGSNSGNGIGQPIVVVDDETNPDEETTVDDTNTPTIPEGIVMIKDLTAPEGYVYSELTGELIDASIANQRPLAVMVDNELTALDHFGINDCDIVYECMNSTKNGRITRLMCIIKDYAKIEQLGSVRSARTVNMVLSAEWNAILCHDGGPFYINDYYAKPEVNHLNGCFSRVNNGKAVEFTEYVLAKDVTNYLGDNAAFDTQYNSYYTGEHFQFVSNNALDTGTYNEIKSVTDIYLPYDHNSSELHYNESTGLYEYYEYGGPHKDAVTGEVLAFTNLLVLCVDYVEYDENGYLWYKIQGGNDWGYYVTQGKAGRIQWYKGNDLTDNMHFIDDGFNDIYINAGKTYITFVPKDVWDQLVMQ